MKRLLILILLIVLTRSFGQEKGPADLDLSFFSVVVKNADSSRQWYTKLLGFELINQTGNKERGFQIYNLHRNNIKLELIQLRSAIDPKDSLSTYNFKTILTGIFKIGFTVNDFDRWISLIEKEKVKTRGNVVIEKESGKRMIVLLDPDGNRVQLFEK